MSDTGYIRLLQAYLDVGYRGADHEHRIASVERVIASRTASADEQAQLIALLEKLKQLPHKRPTLVPGESFRQ